MGDDKDQASIENPEVSAENVNTDASQEAPNPSPQQPLVDDVRPPVQKIEISDGNDNDSPDEPAESEIPTESSTGPFDGEDDQPSPEDAIAPQEQAVQTPGEVIEAPEEPPVETQDVVPVVDSGEEMAPQEEAPKTDSPTDQDASAEDAEAEIAKAAAPDSLSQASAAAAATHKSPLGVIIVVVTVALALIALAVVSFTMMNNAKVDDASSGQSATQQAANTVTPESASEDVTTTTEDIDQALSGIDAADATDLNQSDLSDATLGL